MQNEQEEKENIQLLYKYLSKLYGKDKAKKLMQDNYNKLFTYHGLAWFVGKQSLEFFNLYFLHDVFIGEDKAEISETHKEIWDELQKIILGKEISNKKVYICPRGFGKTTFISQSSSIWSAVYKFKRYIILCSAIGDTADEFINNIKMALQNNKRIEKAFGKIYDPKHFTDNSEIIDLANGVRIKSISSNSVFRGKNYGNIRPELVILDDYQSDEEVATEEQREKKWKRFQDDVMKSVQQNTCVLIACGTIQRRDCFYGRLSKDATWLHRIEKCIQMDNIDTYFNSNLWLEFKNILQNNKYDSDINLKNAQDFYKEHEKEMQFPMLWQDWWNCYDKAIEYYGNPISFKQEYQNDVEHIGEKWFKSNRVESPAEIENHNFKKTMLCVDPASTANKKSDSFAFCVGSLADNGFKYIRKGQLIKYDAATEMDLYINHIIELLKKYDDIIAIYIEKNTFNGADVNMLQQEIKKDKILTARNIQIINEMQHKNKDNKIATIVPDVNNGRIIFNKDDVEFINEIMDFCGQDYSIYDDAPDAVSEFANRIDSVKVIQPVKFFDKRLLF